MSSSDTALLFSGGIDSTALAYWQKPNLLITIDYGQVSAPGELRASKQIASELGIEHEIIVINCRSIGVGDLAGTPNVSGAPASEWWPFRNQLLVTFAAARAFVLGLQVLQVGSVKSDTFHVDGRREFFEHLSRLIEMQEGAIRVEAPASDLTSTELVRLACVPASMLGWTHSCHKASFACGQCRGCNKHKATMRELGYAD